MPDIERSSSPSHRRNSKVAGLLAKRQNVPLPVGIGWRVVPTLSGLGDEDFDPLETDILAQAEKDRKAKEDRRYVDEFKHGPTLQQMQAFVERERVIRQKMLEMVQDHRRKAGVEIDEMLGSDLVKTEKRGKSASKRKTRGTKSEPGVGKSQKPGPSSKTEVQQFSETDLSRQATHRASAARIELEAAEFTRMSLERGLISKEDKKHQQPGLPDEVMNKAITSEQEHEPAAFESIGTLREFGGISYVDFGENETEQYPDLREHLGFTEEEMPELSKSRLAAARNCKEKALAEEEVLKKRRAEAAVEAEELSARARETKALTRAKRSQAIAREQDLIDFRSRFAIQNAEEEGGAGIDRELMEGASTLLNFSRKSTESQSQIPAFLPPAISPTDDDTEIDENAPIPENTETTRSTTAAGSRDRRRPKRETTPSRRQREADEAAASAARQCKPRRPAASSSGVTKPASKARTKRKPTPSGKGKGAKSGNTAANDEQPPAEASEPTADEVAPDGAKATDDHTEGNDHTTPAVDKPAEDSHPTPARSSDEAQTPAASDVAPSIKTSDSDNTPPPPPFTGPRIIIKVRGIDRYALRHGLAPPDAPASTAPQTMTGSSGSLMPAVASGPRSPPLASPPVNSTSAPTSLLPAPTVTDAPKARSAPASLAPTTPAPAVPEPATLAPTSAAAPLRKKGKRTQGAEPSTPPIPSPDSSTPSSSPPRRGEKRKRTKEDEVHEAIEAAKQEPDAKRSLRRRK